MKRDGPRTPGPWAWDFGGTNCLHNKTELDRWRGAWGPMDEPTAIVETDGRYYGPNDKDAWLIAAAPLMYQMLKFILEGHSLELVNPLVMLAETGDYEKSGVADLIKDGAFEDTEGVET